MLPKNFYENVEIPGILKKVLYSDSVAENHTVLIQFKDNFQVQSIEFNKLWDYLTDVLQLKVIKDKNSKEYIYIEDQIKIINYDVVKDDLISTNPTYIMRHYVEDELIRLQLSKSSFLDVTKNHSLLNYNKHKLKFDIVKPKDITYLPIINDHRVFKNTGIFFGNGTSSLNDSVTRIKKNRHLKHIRAIKINKKKNIEYKGYVYDIEIPKTHNYFTDGILVHNTDSIYIIIPTKIKSTEMVKEDRWDKVLEVAEVINDAIGKYMETYYLPRSNIKPEHNMTSFKSELLMTSMFFTGVKKHYAYNTECIEGKFLSKIETQYKGVPIVKSNAAKLSQNLLQRMIEDVMLNINITKSDKKEALIKLINQFIKIFQDSILEFKFDEIGVPCKWGKQQQIIAGMELYNFIFDEEVFNSGSSGRFVYCQFQNKNKFNNKINLEKTNGICVPYEYDSNLLKEKLNNYHIIIDGETQWKTLFSKTCQRVVDCCKFLID